MNALRTPNGTVDDDVFTGFWINNSLGRFYGATLTLDQFFGGFVISFITLFIATAANSVWKIARFALHMKCASTESKQDGVHHQRQVLLRNMTIATDAVVQSIRLGYVWRRRAQRPRRRAVLLMIVASIVSIISTATGILSPLLLKSSTRDVLLTGGECEQLPFRSFEEKKTEDLSYATRCYHKQQANLCAKFTRPALNYSSNKDAPCPFAGDICKSSSANIILDSGNIDSLNDLGLNSGPRFLMSYRIHCAPIVSEGYTETIQTRYFDRPLTFYKYGTNSKNGDDFVFRTELYNQTRRTSLAGLNLGGTYKTAVVSSSEAGITLIPQLMQSHDAVSLVFLDSSQVVYFNKTEDPWYSATIKTNESDPETGWLADEPTSVMACAAELWFCSPDKPKPGGCISLSPGGGEIEDVWPKAEDQQFIVPILLTIGEQGLEWATSFYEVSGAVPLLSRTTMLGSIQVDAIPSDRWQDEIEHVYRASLASMQSSVVEYARGWWPGITACDLKYPCQRTCNTQRVRSTKFYSFSTWALVIILSVGSLVMLIGFFLEELVGLGLKYASSKMRERLTPALASWQAESTLQLQRMAHEAIGVDSWTRTDESIPVTDKGTVLGIYDTSNSKHTRLIKPTSSTSSINVTSTEYLGVNPKFTNESSTNPRIATTFDLSLPAFNSNLSLPTTFSTEENHVYAPISRSDTANADLNNTNNSTTSLFATANIQENQADISSIRYSYGNISEDNPSDDEISRHRLSYDTIPLRALSHTRSER
ncbi:hypothetical protein OPT61_g6357 [Boeremia exigua]|uniref:Uncharacterized protein n=1 Tax=Boeremia exigua TaxID=749465 RepID=A0ACC2I713_9PLEO|nr:hypothetical protein OPT61_g6357 [Boeremia exigua]